MVVWLGLEKYHSPSMRTLEAAGPSSGTSPGTRLATCCTLRQGREPPAQARCGGAANIVDDRPPGRRFTRGQGHRREQSGEEHQGGCLFRFGQRAEFPLMKAAPRSSDAQLANAMGLQPLGCPRLDIGRRPTTIGPALALPRRPPPLSTPLHGSN